MRRLLLLAALICSSVFGDGGTVLFRSAAGPFNITVFSQADAVHTGMNDFSVLVEKQGGQTVMDAKVLLHLTRSNKGEITRVTAVATHAKATNKTLYAATMNVPATGEWKLTVELSAGAENALAAGNIDVKPPQPPIVNYWPYVAMVPCLGLALMLNRWLKKRMGAGRRLR